MSRRDGDLGELRALLAQPRVHELPAPDRRRSLVGVVARDLVILGVATAVTIAVLHAARVGVPVWLVLSAVLALRLLRLAIGQVAPPPPPPRPAPHVPAGPDRELVRRAVHRFERRLDWAAGDRDQFVRSVRPLIAEVAGERLRLRHGVTLTSDPARELLGEPLWHLLTDPEPAVPAPGDWPAHLEALGQL